MPTPLSYKIAGVDVDRANATVPVLKKIAARTTTPGVLSGIGGFASLFDLGAMGHVPNPVLVASTDGVGTKLLMALATSRLLHIGQDLVAMCVNDVVTTGARPLFFLDYIATSKLDEQQLFTIITSIADACQACGCALVGGETAEMPGLYAKKHFDIAGFSVGVVDKTKIIDPKNVRVGDVLIGLSSSGPHSNGFSLIRKVFDVDNERSSTLDAALVDALMAPTTLYVKPVLRLLEAGIRISAMAHITGGGIIDNLPRVLPENTKARIDVNAWKRPPIFDIIAKTGPVDDADMWKTFNMGIGFVLAVDKNECDVVMALLDETDTAAHIIGDIAVSELATPTVELNHETTA